MLEATTISQTGGHEGSVLTKSELLTMFESIVTRVSSKEISAAELLTVSRDNFGHYNAYSALTPLGTCSQRDLESAFRDFIYKTTGKQQLELLDTGLHNPDIRKHETYYDKLDTHFGITPADAEIILSVLADDRGIISATWAVQRTDLSQKTGLKGSLKLFTTLFSRG